MHKIPVIAVQPFVLDIVHEEFAIRRDPGGLDRAEIYAENFGTRELVGNFAGRVRFFGIQHLQEETSRPSIAQIPVPVPRSMIFCGWSPIGEKKSLPLRFCHVR